MKPQKPLWAVAGKPHPYKGWSRTPSTKTINCPGRGACIASPCRVASNLNFRDLGPSICKDQVANSNGADCLRPHFRFFAMKEVVMKWHTKIPAGLLARL